MNTLDDVVRARSALFRARQHYHERLLRAREEGYTPETIADALETKALYVANTLRLHDEERCSCQRSPSFE